MKNILLIFAIACAHFAVDSMLSIFPAYKTMAAIDLSIAGVIAGCCVFFAEAMQLLFGKWIDKGHHKAILLIGILGTIAASLFPYATDLVTVTLFLLLTYVGSSCFHPAAASILGGLRGHHKHIAMTIFATFGMAGMSIGQLLFTWTIEYIDGHTALLGSMCLFCAITLFCMNLDHPHTGPSHKELSLSLFKKFFCFQPLRSLYFVQLANQTLLWATVFLLPDLLKGRAYDDWVVFGGGHFFFILGAALSPIPAGFISAKFTPQRTIAVSFFLSMLFLAQILFLQELPALFLIANLFLFGAFLGAIPPLVFSLGNELVPHNRGMVSVFLMGMVWIVSETVGIGGSGIIAGFFTTNGAEYSMLLLGLLFSLIGGVYAFRLHKFREEELVFVNNVRD